MRSPRLAVVVNPHASRGASERAAIMLARVLPSDAVLYAPSTMQALAETARAIRERRVPIVAIVGGDGTLHRVLTALHEAYGDEALPAIALLRGGTMNTVANALGIPRRSTSTLLQRALRAAAHGGGAVLERPTIRCDGKLAMLFGVGVVPAFLEAYYATGNPSPLVAAKVLATAIAQRPARGPLWRALTDGLEVGLALDEGTTYPRERVLAIAAGTIDQIGLGFRPFHRAFATDEAMHLVRVRADGAAFAAELPRIRLGRPMSRSGGTDHPTRGFTLESAGSSVAYMLDGDVYEHPGPTLRVTMGPRVRFLRLGR